MHKLTICLLSSTLLASAMMVQAGQGQVGSLLQDMEIKTAEAAAGGYKAPRLFGHLSYYPGSAWGVYDSSDNSNTTMMANYNVSLDLAVPLKIGALGLGVYSMDSDDMTESGFNVAYYAKRTWGLSYGSRKFEYTDSGSDSGPIVEALLFPATKPGKPSFTLGLGASKLWDKWLPSLSVNAAIPWKGNTTLDLSLWGIRDKYSDTSEQWAYRWSAGVGYSF